jgi:hypothetical protein
MTDLGVSLHAWLDRLDSANNVDWYLEELPVRLPDVDDVLRGLAAHHRPARTCTGHGQG